MDRSTFWGPSAAAVLVSPWLVAAALPAAAEDAELRDLVKRQGQEIEALTKQVEELTKILGTRIDKVERQTAEGRVVMTGPGPKVESAGGDFSMAFVGGLQPTGALYDQSSQGGNATTQSLVPDLSSGTDFRRAQFGIQGTVYRDFDYAFVADFAAAGGIRDGVRDAWLRYNGLRPVAVGIGNQKPGNGLEVLMSGRANSLTFMERSLPVDLITATGLRNIGVRATSGGDHYSASLGAFGDDINNNNVTLDADEGWGVHGRASYAPIATADKVAHVGVSGYWRTIGADRGVNNVANTRQLRFRARPEINVDGNRLVDTGVLANAEEARLLGVELAGVYGPISVQGEYVVVAVDQDGPAASHELVFDGGYILASYFLTGESRAYDARNGIFGRFKPKRNFSLSEGGWGAWELALRASFIDLNSHPNDLAGGGVRGGEQIDYTVGLNWYLNPYVRMMFNYVHADADNLSAAGLQEGATVDIYALRAQFEW